MVVWKFLSRKLSRLESCLAHKQPLSAKVSTISTESGLGAEDVHFSGSDFLELLRPLLDGGHTVRFQAHGVSMTPVIRNGDTVTVSPISAYSIQLGDVVAAESPLMGRVVLHRVIKREPGGLILRADNAGVPDGFVAERAVMGKVVCVHRNGQSVRLAKGLEAMMLAFLSRHGVLHRLNRLGELLGAVFNLR
jgi:hypothetical protein